MQGFCNNAVNLGIMNKNFSAGDRYEADHFIDTSRPVWNYSLFTEEDVRNFQNGTHYNLYRVFGNTALVVQETEGVYFAVWAPSAKWVTVIGDFNDWNKESHPLFPRLDKSGIWEGFIPSVTRGQRYKYCITTQKNTVIDKGDPFAHYWEKPPQTASVVWNLRYDWNDAKWMQHRKKKNSLQSPWSVYEMHLGSWMRPDKNDENRYNTYLQIAERLVPYLTEMGFTHVEFMPVMEHPFDGSWGYQGTGFFAPTSRFGTPEDFMHLIDALHDANIGVILDWVPSHFPHDAHGLFMFDGAHTYEYADMRKGFHPDWNSYIFNYKRGEVKSFLISSAKFWCEQMHADGLRVDAVSSMLKLDYSRNEGEWEPNEFGGNGNLEAIAFIKDLNETLYRDLDGIQTIAEEATDWPGVSKPTTSGGLGFGMKWMMGWMQDTLKYFKKDPWFKQFHQDEFSFSMMYFYDENFMLPFSHDEVVHGKSPMIYKMPGDEWQKFANLRLLYGYMFTHPGTKLLFMGNEFAQTAEWSHRTELQWELLNYAPHKGVQQCVKDLNQLYRTEPALYERQFEPGGFQWLDLNHRSESVVSYIRRGFEPNDDLIIVLNFTPEPRKNWKLRLEGFGAWEEIFNSDAVVYGGTGDYINTVIKAIPVNKQEVNRKKEAGRKILPQKKKQLQPTTFDVEIAVPPLSAIVLKQRVKHDFSQVEKEIVK